MRGTPIHYGAEVRRKLDEMSERIAAYAVMRDETACSCTDYEALGGSAEGLVMLSEHSRFGSPNQRCFSPLSG